MIPPCLLNQIIAAAAETQPAAPALLAPDKEALTYQALARHLSSTTLQLTRWGIRPGDCVAVVLPNGPDMAAAFLAVSSVCTCAPLNPAYLVDDFKFSMRDLKSRALVTSFPDGHPARQAASALDIPVIQLTPDSRFAGLFSLSSALPVDETLTEPVFMGLDDTALVLHTSGTTSRPKIVPLTHRNIFHSAHNIAAVYALSPADRCLNQMPLFHIHGLIGAVAATLVSGGSVICAPGFVALQVLDWLTKLSPTWYTAVPTMHQSVLDQANHQPEIARTTRLRFIRSCSSSLAPQLGQDLEAMFGVPVLEAYGMTEATHQIASNPLPPEAHKFGSVGRATGTTQACILDGVGGPLPRNAIGEICIRGANVITGYANNPEANRTSFANGWLRTGDRGYMDEEGYIFIQGRLKELINRGGEKISPREIDETLQQHPAVKQAVAFAVPHPSLGEDVAAAIVLQPGKTVSMHEIRQFAAEHLADFKVPRVVVFVSEIPKGPTGKVQRIGLAEKLEKELETVKAHESPDGAAPRTPVEEKLQSIWQQALNQAHVGVEDDFFTLGGDSIMAARILMLVEKEFQVALKLKDIFAAPTIASLAVLIQQKQG